MRFPNKITSYNESIIPKMIILARVISSGDISPSKLYAKSKREIPDYKEFIDALDCLYAIGRIDFDYSKEIITYANRDFL